MYLITGIQNTQSKNQRTTRRIKQIHSCSQRFQYVPFSMLDRTNRQNIRKNMVDMNTIKQLDLINKYRPCHVTTPEYTFFSRVHRTFTNILGHKTSSNNFENIRVIQNMFSDHMLLNWKSITKIPRKSSNIWKCNHIPLILL